MSCNTLKYTNVAGEWSLLLLNIREVLGANLDPGTDHLD
jgi:hypothetical protein